MKPFTHEDLFGHIPADLIDSRHAAECIECGALVARPLTHKEWHNKVADL